MTNLVQASRRTRGAAAVALAALVGGGLVLPLASPASASVAHAETAAASPASADATPVVPTDSLLGTGTSWKYLDTNTDPAPGGADRNVWTTPDFDDAAWPSAVTGFGVKKNELAAVGPFTPATKLEHYIDGDAKRTVPTYFFRTTVELDPGVAAAVAQVTGTIVHDDAARVFVNGEKVAGLFDARVDDTAPSNLQYAGEGKSDPVTSTFTVDPKLLRDGENTIAVALYQDRESSSDAYFDMPRLELSGADGDGGAGAEPAAPSRVILTPTATPAVSQSLSWLAGEDAHTTGQVEIGLAAGGDTRTLEATPVGAVNGNAKQHFSATVTELTPGTAYRYRVGVPERMSEWFSFTTETPGATDFQFVYYGDAQIGLDTTWPEVVRQAEQQAPRSIGSVHAGDLINTGSNDTEWLNWFAGMERSARSTNVMAAPGNHEYSGDKTLASWKAHFEYPLNQPSTDTIGELAARATGDSDVAKQYAAYFEHWADFAAETVYYTDYQDVRFITLNATRDTTFLKPPTLPSCSGEECPSTKVQALWTEYQAAWLDFVLKHSPSKWNVVTFHQPVYSTSKGRNEPVLREHWVPVFQENDIDLVLMGHDHTYARGFNNADVTGERGITTGPVYAVSNSGAKHYDLESEENNVWTLNGATQVIRGERVTTYQVIDVAADSLTYRSYVSETVPGSKAFALTDAPGERPVYAEQAVPQVGEVFDEFVLTKYDTGEKWVTEPGLQAPAGPALTLSAPSVAAGDSVTVTGTGFAPGSTIALELHSDPVALGTVEVDTARAFEAKVTIPQDTAVGDDHELVAVLPSGKTVSSPITVTAATGGEPDGPGGETDGPGGETEGPDEQPGGAGPNPGDTGQQGGAQAGTGTGTAGASDSIADTGSAPWLPLGGTVFALLSVGTALLVRRGVLARREAVAGDVS